MKGRVPWNKGKKGLQVAWSKGKKLPQRSGENSPSWKGDKVGYQGVHRWLRITFGTPRVCEECGTTEASRYEWANISGEYKRLRSDYRRLCKKCHNDFDGVNAWQNWKRSKGYPL